MCPTSPADNPPDLAETKRVDQGDSPAGRFRELIERRRSQTSLAQALLVTLIAALVTAPVALLVSFVDFRPSEKSAIVWLVALVPTIEEILKLAGMMLLIKLRPWLITGGWQFPIAAILSALAFATVENFLYLEIYAAHYSPADLAELASYRWTVCVIVHIGCSIIASMGMLRVWDHHIKSRQPAQLWRALTMLTLAIVVHGAYNWWSVN
ncbi:PrsW family glutamic-type intramembrane protease [Sulfuriroseicoccus oceanibius]|uniref:PrsW family intramembrane metalloprotease n=1 Tax=Sulfuriroseicoccus oceanibius TaxID=2707525 RepID=A0A6B3L7J2_9BACT|nr:PrsW family glutamic-type intramembrane protease [Sulfuriroseicoccus oceanibius]QQL43700.1 PrsW family intramembrane metalloprotease [Sulfuriroseicoccus oceanibius]